MSSDRAESASECSVTSRDLSDYLAAAMRVHRIEILEVAFWWKCHASYVSRVLSHDKTLTVKRVKELPAFMQRTMHAEWGTDLKVLVGRKAALLAVLEGINAFVQDEEPARLPARTQRQAKADLETPPTKKAVGGRD